MWSPGPWLLLPLNGLARPDQRETRTFWNMRRGILGCVSGHLLIKTKATPPPTLGWHKGASRILINHEAGAPDSSDLSVFKGPILMALATGKRTASSRVLVLLRSRAHVCHPVCLTDVWVSASALPETVSVCRSFCGLCVSRPVWGCPATL